MDRPVLRDVAWRKSSRSKAASNCVEVARLRPGVAIRDSKAPNGPALTVAPAAWARFVDLVKAGDHDLIR